MAEVNAPISGGLQAETYNSGVGSALRQAVVVGSASGTQTTTVGTGGDLLVSISSPGSAAAGITATIGGDGTLLVTPPSGVMFSDTFEGGVLDTSVRWVDVGASLPIVTQGLLSLAPGAVANNAIALTTKPSFTFANSTTFAAGIAFESGTTITGCHRFFGVGTSNANTFASPLYDAIGFEITTAGVLQAVVYNAGVQTIVASSLSMPTDGASHRYVLVTRGDVSWWYKDTFDVPAAFSFVTPSSQRLPMRLHSLNGGSPSGSPTYSVTAAAVYDGSHSSYMLSDPSAPWVRATVRDASTAPLATDPALVVSLSPNGALPGVKITGGELVVAESSASSILLELRRISRYLSELTGTTYSDDDLER